MVVRKKRSAVRKAGKKAAAKTAKKGGRKAKAGKAARTSVRRPSKKPAKKPPRKPVKKPPRRPPRPPVVVVEGVPLETVREVYVALSQIRGAIYGLVEAFLASEQCEDFELSFLGAPKLNNTEELVRVTGHKCDTLFPDGIVAGDPEDTVLFTKALLLLREWLQNCMDVLLPSSAQIPASAAGGGGTTLA